MTTIFLDKERITNDDLLAVVCLTLGLFLLVINDSIFVDFN